jgi:hypothetical protein
MIQRVQTIYLFLAALLCILLFFMPLASMTVPAPGAIPLAEDPEGLTDPAQRMEDQTVTYELDVFSIDRKFGMISTTVKSTYALAGINALVLILSLIVIFLYTNRLLQAQLVRFCFLLVLIFIVIAFYYGTELQNVTRISAPVDYKIADLFPILQLLFFHLAVRGINKDEALVRSADRIR